MKVKLLSIVLSFLFFIACGESDQTWDKDGVSFKYPKDLSVSVDEFELYPKANIYVETSSISDFVEDCVQSNFERYGRDEFELREEYKEIFNTLKDKGVDRTVEDFDNLSCGWTMGNIYSEAIGIDGYNGVLHHVSLSQDAGGLNVFFTQIIFVDKYDQVHSIVFSYDFGELGEYFDTIRDEYGSVGIEADYDDIPQEWGKIVDFFVYGTPIENEKLEGFAENKEVIFDIIKTIRVE